jgi:ADP-heptose:LPS heptosyltransferase
MSFWMCFSYKDKPEVILVDRTDDVYYRNHELQNGLNIIGQLDNVGHIINLYNRKQDLKISSDVKFIRTYKSIPNGYNGKIFFMRSGAGVGDLLNIEPTMCFMKDRFPNAQIAIVHSKQYLDLFTKHPFVKAYPLPIPYDKLLGGFVFDYHSIPELSALPDRYAIENFASFAGIDVTKHDIPNPNIYLDVVSVGKWSQWKAEHCDPNLPTIVFQLSSSKPMKTYPPDFLLQFLDTIAKKNANVIILATPDQVYQYIQKDVMMDMINGNTNFLLPNTPRLSDAISLLSLADVVVSSDSLSIHVANILNIPTVGIWLGVIPPTLLKNNSVTNIVSDYPCYPCRLHQVENCAFKEKTEFAPCWRGIDFEKIKSTVFSLLEDR